MLNFICPRHVLFKTSFCFLKKNAKKALNWQTFLRGKLLQPLDQIECAIINPGMSFLIWKLGYSTFIAEIHSKLGTSSFHFSILSFHLVLESSGSLFKKLVLISVYWSALLRHFNCCRRIILGSSRVKRLPKLFCISKGTTV